MSKKRDITLQMLPSACRLTVALLFVSILALQASCGSSKTLPGQQESSPAAGFASLPLPATLRHASYIPAELVCCGWEYITTTGFPLQNACGVDECCEFTPGWTAADPSIDGLAYACFGFDMAGYDRANMITFNWAQQGDPADLWIGLADFTHNCWSWHVLADGSTLELALADYIDPVSKRMLVLPLMTGTGTWQLASIHIGDLVSVSGTVLAGDGVSGLPDAEVVLEGVQTYSARAGYDGSWQLHGVLPGNYEVSAHLIGWSFTPESTSLAASALQEQVDDFTGAPGPTHTARGTAQDLYLNPLGGTEIKVTLQDSPYGSVSTWVEFDGGWSIDLPDGDFAATPDLPGWFFTPESRQFSIAGGDTQVDVFTGEQLPGYLMDGYIYLTDGTTPVSDVQLLVDNISEGLSYYATTGLDGYWSVPEAIDGDYTIEPQLYGWSFEPTTQAATVAGTSVRVPPFTGGQLGMQTVDGYIYLDGGTTPLPDISVELLGDYGWYYATTNSAGHYVFDDVFEGSYTVCPADVSYEFAPEQRVINVLGDLTVDPFYAILLPTYQVDGYIFQPDGTTGIAGVEVEIYAYMPPGTSFITTTDAGGYWQLPSIPNGYYTVWPQLQGYTFEPGDQSILVEDADLTVPDFTGTPLPAYSISGYVYETDGSTPVPWVYISLTGWNYYYATMTDDSGYWELHGVCEDIYEVTPMLAPWSFTPDLREVEVSGGNATVDPFLGEMLEAWAVDGYLYEAGSTTPIPNVAVWFTSLDHSYWCISDADGYYQILLPAGEWYAWPSSSCMTFEPVEQVFTMSGAPLTLDVFYGTPGG